MSNYEKWYVIDNISSQAIKMVMANNLDDAKSQCNFDFLNCSLVTKGMVNCSKISSHQDAITRYDNLLPIREKFLQSLESAGCCFIEPVASSAIFNVNVNLMYFQAKDSKNNFRYIIGVIPTYGIQYFSIKTGANKDECITLTSVTQAVWDIQKEFLGKES